MSVRTERIFFPALEGIRGIASLIVLFNHVGVYTGVIGSQLFGAPGVPVVGAVFNKFEVGLPIFFALSGVLLYRPFALATLTDSRRPPAGPYFWRRVLRIFPAYWVVTVVALVVLNRDAITGLWSVLRPLLVLQTYQQDAIPAGMGQTWSLGVEVPFYLLLPLFAVAVNRFARRAADERSRVRRMIVPLAVLVVVGLGFTVFTHLPSMGPYPLSSLWLPEYVGFLAVGMMLAVFSAREQVSGGGDGLYGLAVRHPAWCWGGAAAVFVLACTPVGNPSTIDYPSAGPAALIELMYLVFVFLLVGPMTVPGGRSRLVATALGNPVAQFLGRISYGVFLWHVIFLDGWYAWTGWTPGAGGFWPVLAVTLPGALVCATISYYVVELPAMRLRPRLGNAPVEPSTPVPADIRA
jgi:peptidoglycan/LPS O-acetylase OafA/YrhL